MTHNTPPSLRTYYDQWTAQCPEATEGVVSDMSDALIDYPLMYCVGRLPGAPAADQYVVTVTRTGVQQEGLSSDTIKFSYYDGSSTITVATTEPFDTNTAQEVFNVPGIPSQFVEPLDFDAAAARTRELFGKLEFSTPTADLDELAIIMATYRSQ